MIEQPSGFLTPTGELIKCSYLEHWYTAEEICRENNWEWEISPVDELIEKHGFVHLFYSFFGRKEYHTVWGENHLTQEQIRFLKPMFEAFEDEIDVPLGISSRTSFEIELGEYMEQEGGR